MAEGQKEPPPPEFLFLSPLENETVTYRDTRIYQPRDKELKTNTYIFDIPNKEQMSVIDLPNVKMLLHLELIKSSNSAKLANDELTCVPANDLPHEMWRNVQVKINNVIVSSNDNHYATRAFYKKMKNYTKELQEMEFDYTGFYAGEDMHDKVGEAVRYKEETTGDVGGTTAVLTKEVDANLADKCQGLFFQRGTDTATAGRSHWFEDHIYECPFTGHSYLPYGIPLEVTFTKHSKQSFYLKGANQALYEVKVKDFILKVPYLQLSPEAFMNLETSITSKDTPMLSMWMDSLVVTDKALVDGRTEHGIDNLFGTRAGGVMPELVTFGITSVDSWEGKPTTFNHLYEHNKLKRYTFTLPGARQLPSTQLPAMDFAEGQFELPYKDLLEAWQLKANGQSTVLTKEVFAESQCLFAVQFTPLPPDPNTAQSTGIGDMNLDLTFDTAPNRKTLVLFGEFKDRISIGKNKEIMVSW